MSVGAVRGPARRRGKRRRDDAAAAPRREEDFSRLLGRERAARAAAEQAAALSALDQREDRVKALAEGFRMHLTKPVAPAELIVVVSSVARGIGA